MKSLLIICRQSPANIKLAQSALDAALAGGIFEQHIAIAFIGEGVKQLSAEYTPVGEKNLAAQIQALPFYGIEKIFIENRAVEKYAINENDLKKISHELISDNKLRKIMNDYDQVVTF